VTEHPETLTLMHATPLQQNKQTKSPTDHLCDTNLQEEVIARIDGALTHIVCSPSSSIVACWLLELFHSIRIEPPSLQQHVISVSRG
jgi:hypothetical protein